MTSPRSPLDRLRYCLGVDDLKRELRALCAPYGTISRLDVLRSQRSGKRQAICLWRMESHEREQQVISEFGVGRFGGDLVAVVELQPPPAGEGQESPYPRSGWGDLQPLGPPG